MELSKEWKKNEKSLQRTIICKDFKEAMGLMVQIGIEAEKMNHHPEWFNVYNKIEITLTTHDTGGISDKDYELANKIDLIISK